MLVGFAEGLGAAKTYATRHHYEVDPNRELLGLGAANLASGLASGMVVNGSLSKTAVNGAAGAHTQVSGLVCAALTVVTLLFLTGLFEELPGGDAGGRRHRRGHRARRRPRARDGCTACTRARSARPTAIAARPDFIAAVAAMLGVLVFDTLPGLFLGIAISLVLLVYRVVATARSRCSGSVKGTAGQYGDVERHPENEQPDGVAVLRVESGLFFANAEHVRGAVRAHVRDDTRAVVIDAETVPFIDVSAARMLGELADDLEREHVELVIARDVGQVRDVLGRTDPGRAPVRTFPSVQEAVDALAAQASPTGVRSAHPEPT